MVASESTPQAAWAACANTPLVPAPSGPSSTSTSSSTVTSAAGRASVYPPLTPRWERRIPARRRLANSCSKNCTGIWRRRASSAIGTGPEACSRCSSTSALSAYGDFVVIDSIRRSILRDRRGSDPAALGRDQHGLGTIHRPELAVDVVQVGPDRARRESQLARDLLVDHPLRQATQNIDLTARPPGR